jgi:superfamily II DNA or RNA helicase
LPDEAIRESTLVNYEGEIRNVIDSRIRFGMHELTLAGLPRRFYDACNRRSNSAAVYQMVDARQVSALPSLAEAAVTKLDNGESWLASTRKAGNALLAWFLLAEDKQQRLESLEIAPLMHQQTLVEHILTGDDLSRVLIGDEVGLGKTVEAGLVAKRLLAGNAAARVLYLAPAQLIGNVVAEFRRLGMDPRRWSSGSTGDVRLDIDSVVVASIQKSVRDENAKRLRDAGPWDLIIVDECHHLSDYEPGGGAPNAGYRLVRDLLREQRPDGRILLMSGTPHQGNQARFENVLALLTRPGENIEDVAGRVIYRTKESVRDWKGRPLFPTRDVRAPRTASLGLDWSTWYENVSALYDMAQLSSPQSRAGGWARGQALQWVASSVEAGLAYLVRLAIRRLNLDESEPNLAPALAAIRPYRGGPLNEPLPALVERIRRSMKVAMVEKEPDLDDDEPDDVAWRPDPVALGKLLRDGSRLANAGADREKWRVMLDLLEEAGSEKVVLFCQPVETVGVVSRCIAQHFGREPAVIVGGQTEQERKQQVDAFRQPDGPQFLVSSRAGSEGINLQVSRRVIHLDIPWNPMDMEQRVGRVHRFGSQNTIIVDTVVVPGSREADAYRIAREKLRLIAEQLDPEQFEQLFGRVMNLVPPEELADVLATSPPVSQSSEMEHRLADIVRAGYSKLQTFSKAYSEGAERIRAVDPGSATWADLRTFMERAGDASSGAPASMRVFELSGDGVTFHDRTVETLEVFGQRLICDETDGLPSYDSDGQPIARLGISDRRVVDLLAQAVFSQPADRVGAIRLRAAEAAKFTGERLTTFAISIYAVHTLAFVRGTVEEKELRLCAFIIAPDRRATEVPSARLCDLVRTFLIAERQTRPTDEVLRSVLTYSKNVEVDVANALRGGNNSDTPGELAAIWPVCWIAVATT